MEQDWEIGEDEWVVGELIAPEGGESPPSSSDQATDAVSLPTVEEELEIGGEEWAIGEFEAPGRGRESPPPLLDQPTPPPPPPPDYLPARGSPLAQDHATAAIIRSNKRGRVPASSKAIEGLREVTAPPTDKCCAICLQDFDSHPDPAGTPPSDLRRLRAMPCSHTFHEHCIFEWLRRNAACPLCRHQLPTEEVVDEEDQGRRSRSRIVYNPEDGRYHVLWYMNSRDAFAGDEEDVDPEHAAYMREALARWDDIVASWRSTS